MASRDALTHKPPLYCHNLTTATFPHAGVIRYSTRWKWYGVILSLSGSGLHATLHLSYTFLASNTIDDT